eukprot:g40329.t1
MDPGSDEVDLKTQQLAAIQQQVLMMKIQSEQIDNATKKCWHKCVDDPSSSLQQHEAACLQRCAVRYFEVLSINTEAGIRK